MGTGEMKKVLIADDDVAVTNYLMVFLMQTELYEPTVVNDSRVIPELLEREHFDALLLDMDMPNISGMDVLQLVKDKRIPTPVIVLTGVNDVDLAVKAMKLGAFDYLTKPVDDSYLLEVFENAIAHSATHSRIDQMPAGLAREDLEFAEAFVHFPTQDPELIRVLHKAEKMAAGDLSIFIWGERGTGKEMLARAIHDSSPRAQMPFIAVDVAAISPDMLAPAIFGQARDYSGSREEQPGFIEQASGGTLFLDEIDRLTLPVQMRLKRFIQAGEFYRECSTLINKLDVRIIAASRHDLTSEEYRYTFSRDLLYHLMVNSLQLPPLRDRVEDVPLLALYFLDKEAEKVGKKFEGITTEFIDALKAYSFPGNRQELRSIIASAVVSESGDTITIASVPKHILAAATASAQTRADFKPRRLEEIEREHVAKVLDYFERDYETAAKALGISVAEVKAFVGHGSR
jgi:two-component system, NtrC family, response regulator HydG